MSKADDQSSEVRAAGASVIRTLLWTLVSCLLGGATLAQTPGPNRNVVSGVVDPMSLDDPSAVIKSDLLRQRQNEPVIAPSSTNPEHLLAAANDYRTIDIAADTGTGERDDAPLARALARVIVFFKSVLGIETEPIPTPKANADAWVGVYRSCDRGRTWIGSLLPGSPTDQSSAASLASPLHGLTTASDPVMAPAPDGRAFLGGLAFTRGGTSAIFVARYTDRNDREGGACFTYDFTRVVEAGSASETGRFADKPAIAADVARTWGNVSRRYTYMAYTIFTGLETDANFRGRVRFVRSEDDGETWSKPVTVSGNRIHNQGAALAIDPVDGDLYLIWRDFVANEIVMTTSHDFGLKWSDPEPITPEPIAAFDQITGEEQFRSNGFPTIVIDGNSNVFVAWQERVDGLGAPDPQGSPRIVLTMSEEISNQGVVWSQRHVVEMGTGPQVMPALSAHAGQLMLLYAEAVGVDPSADPVGIDLRLDVRVAELNPETGALFEGQSSVPVSEYTRQATHETGEDGLPPLIEIAEGFPAYHRPNLPMFRNGSVPFIGDYEWLGAAQPYVRTADGGWKWASDPGDVASPSFHAIWTDNRNVQFPGGLINGRWDIYYPRGTEEDPCANPGSRNQDVFTSEISNGLVAGSPSLFKPLLRPGGEPIQRAFVAYVENRTDESRFVLLNLVPKPGTDTTASFDQFDPYLTYLPPPGDVLYDSLEILPHSTLTRTVYVESTTADATVDLEVWDETGENVLARVVLNQSDSPFGLTNTNISDSETHTPRISNPRISNPRISNPRISNPRISNWTVNNPRISNPRISNPRISNEALAAGWETRDVTYTMINAGNTTTVYDLQTYIPDEYLAEGSPYEFQLIVSRTVSTVDTEVDGSRCVPVEVLYDEFLSSIESPRISNPRISNPDLWNPRISNPRISNASFYLEPAEGPIAASLAAGPSSQPLSGTRSATAELAGASATTFEALTAAATGTAADTGDLSAPLPVPQVQWTLRIFQTRALDPGEPTIEELAPLDPTVEPQISAAVVSQSTNVIDGVPEEEPPYVLVGPEPPVPEREVDGGVEPIGTATISASGLAFSQQPASTQVGDTITPPVEVRLVDSAGATVPVTGIPVTVELSAGVLSGTTTQLTDSGFAVFDDLFVGVVADGYTLTATAPDLGSATSSPFDITVGRPTVPPLMTRVSVDSGENQGAGPGVGCAGGRSITSDGRFVAFDCTFTNLVPGDTNDARDVFVRDRQDGTTTRVSVTSLGEEADGDSLFGSMSDNGRFVAFQSFATNLDTPTPDANEVSDIYVHDRQTGITKRVSVGLDGEANGASTFPVISGDGQNVAFWSDATNLVADDTNGEPDVFVVELATLSTSRVSVKTGGEQANSVEGAALPAAPAISADGQVVAFQSTRADLADQGKVGWRDIYVHDRNTTTTTRVSVASDGTAGTIPKGCGPWDGPDGKFACADFANSNPSLSADGRYVAFDSIYDNLVPGDTNFDGLYLGRDVFVHDRELHTTTRVSVSSEGAQDNTYSPSGAACGVGPNSPAMSPDGRFVTFSSCGSSLVVNDTNDISDAFLHDRSLGTTVRSSTYSGGAQVTTSSGAFGTHFTAASRGARFLAMGSDVETMVDGDTNRNVALGEFGGDVFVSEPLPAPAPPAERFLVFAVQPSDTPERDPITPAIQVEIQDAAGNTDLTATDLVTLSVDSGLGILQGVATVNAVAGVAVFSGLTLTEEGPHTLRANAAGFLGVVSAPFTVLAPSATRLGFVVQPVNTEAGATMAPVQVAIQDDSGTTVVTRSDTITLALLGDGDGILLGTTSVAAVDGVAVFDDLSVDVADTAYSLEATATDLAGATSDDFDVIPASAPLNLVVTSTADSGEGSLRQAVLAANANVGVYEVITFNLPDPAHPISVATGLPAITDPVGIDGKSQVGYAGVPLVRIDGSATGGATGLDIRASGTLVEALVITGFGWGIEARSANDVVIWGSFVGTDGTSDLGNRLGGIRFTDTVGGGVKACRVSGNDGVGIRLVDSADIAIGSNFIGTNASGDTALPNIGGGIALMGTGSKGNVIGGAEGNVIAGNGGNGIYLWGASQNSIVGNTVGLDASGSEALPNQVNGVEIDQGADNRIEKNIISGNTEYGIRLRPFSSNTTIVGNKVGTDSTGTQSRGNGSGGMFITQSPDNQIGGPADGDGNLISGNADEWGVYAYLSARNVFQGNLIGTTADGSSALAMQTKGIDVYADTPGTIIGGAAPGMGNVISGNVTGISVSGLGGAVIQGNLIGTDDTGLTAVGNVNWGIVLNSTGATVGGASPEERNVISGNGMSGIYTSLSADGNIIQGNYIGLDAGGTSALPNGVGIQIDRSSNHTIGGLAPGQGNVISGNTGDGIRVVGTPLGTVIAGNTVGLGPDRSSAIGNGGNGVSVEGGDATDVVIRDNLISGNGTYGVEVRSGAHGVTVLANHIGTDSSGSLALGNSYGGVSLRDSPNNVIGRPGEGNVISGNTSGISVQSNMSGYSSSGTVIQGNLIGTNAAGTSALTRQSHGVSIGGGSDLAVIGGSGAGEGNVISGNGYGVHLTGSAGAVIRGNLIGTDASGAVAVPNQNGIRIAGDATDTLVGGTAGGARNVVSGNTLQGIRIEGATTSGTRVQGNHIGVDAGGATALGNGEYGLSIYGSSNNEIGGVVPEARNVISGNSQGIMLLTGATGVLVQGNSIGTDASGTTAIPNTGAGIGLSSSGDPVSGNSIRDNLISGNGSAGVSLDGNVSDNTMEGNTIAANGSAGVGSASGVGPGNTLSSNSIFDNGLLGIDLGNDGVTTNDVGDADSGPNNLQNFPIVESAISDSVAGTTEVTVSLDSTPGSTFTIEVFHSSACDPEGYGEGQTYLGATSVATDGSGQAASTATIPGVVPFGSYVTATARAQDGSSSEFSACKVSSTAPAKLAFVEQPTDTAATATMSPAVQVAVQDAGGHTLPGMAHSITLVANGGAGLLSGTTTVDAVDGIATFDDLSIDVVGAGYTLVATATGLEEATSSSFDILPSATPLALSVTTTADSGGGSFRQALVAANANGGTQDVIVFAIPGAGLQTIMLSSPLPLITDSVVLDGTTQGGYAGTPLVRLDGGLLTGGDGLSIQAPASTVRGLMVTGFPGAGILLSGVTGSTIEDSYIGTDGVSALGNAGHGLVVSGGGTNAIRDSVISGNGQAGLMIAASNGATVQGNLIGTNAGGTGVIPNGSQGVLLNTTGAVVGGGGAGEGNVISGNTGDGLALFDVMGAFVAGNWIGTNASGADLGNGGSGVVLSGTVMTNSIGGLGSGEGNVIAFNTEYGVRDTGGFTGTQMFGNSIYSNGLLGILDNGVLGAPLLTSANTSGGTTTISGSVGLFGSPDPFFRIEFFWSTACDASGSGEGERFLGRTELTVGVSGSADFSVPLAAVSGGVITATATSTIGTSGFSACRENTLAPGRVEVTKVVDLSGAAPQGDEQFEICLTGPDASPDVVCQTTGVAGGTLSFDGLAVGQYVVSETDPGPEWAVTIDPAGGVLSVPAGGVGTAIVTNTLQTGNIVVTKATDPIGDPTWFSFTASWDADGFMLVDGGSEDSGPLAPGTYSVEEVPEPGWTASVVCSDGQNPLAINLAGGQTVTCDFTNTIELTARVEVMKVVDLGGADYQGDEVFEICLTGPDVSPDVVCQMIGWTGGTLSFDGLAAGQYTVSETDPGLEWMVTIDAPGGVVSAPVDGVGFVTLTNSLQTGNIIVYKATDPEGDPTFFDFTASWDANGFTLRDGWSEDSGPLAPGMYSVEEIPVAGWGTSVACTGQLPSSIILDPGQTVECTFTNTLEHTAHVEVTKVVDWGGATPQGNEQFDICLTGPDWSPELVCQTIAWTGGTLFFENLAPGQYTVSETDPGLDWMVTIDPPGGIVSVPVEGIGTATVTNSLLTGSIIVTKATDPVGDPTVFSFTASWDVGAFSLSHGEFLDSGPLAPGLYSVEEMPMVGWGTSAACTGGQLPSSINLAGGETVTCDFTNTLLPGPP